MASRYDGIVNAYLATANRLSSLAVHGMTRSFQVPSAEWSQFVKDCEAAISIENEAWMAVWTEKETPKP